MALVSPKKVCRQRSRCCLQENGEFGSRTFGSWTWQVRKPNLNPVLEKIMADPDRFFESARMLKKSRSSTVGAAEGYVLKRYNFRKPLSAIKDLFRPSRAEKAFHKAYHLELCGIPTARPIAMTSRRSGIFFRRSYFLMEELVDTRDPGQWEGDPRLAVKALASLLGQMHQEGFSHRDLKPANLLLDRSNQVYLIDLEGLKYVGDLSPQRARLDLERLERGIVQLKNFKSADRLNFIRAYCRFRGCTPSVIFSAEGK